MDDSNLPVGSIWEFPNGQQVIIRDDGRALAYPSMRLLAIWPDFGRAKQLHAGTEPTDEQVAAWSQEMNHGVPSWESLSEGAREWWRERYRLRHT